MRQASQTQSLWGRFGKLLLSIVLVAGVCPAMALSTLGASHAYALDEGISLASSDSEGSYSVDFSEDMRVIGIMDEAETPAEPDVAALTANLAARFSEGGSDAAISNNTWAAAFALKSLGLASAIDVKSVIANIEGAESYSDPSVKGVEALSVGTLAKYICILDSAGVDCTDVTVGGENVDLVAAMEDKINAICASGSVDEWSAPCILPVYTYCGYACGLSDDEYNAILDLVVKRVGELYEGWGSKDYMTTGQGILAILPLAETNTAVKEALATAWSAFKSDMGTDGSYPSWGNGVDDAALVVAASYAMGYTYEDLFSVGANPVNFILSKVNATNDGFDVTGTESLTASSALLALAAMQSGTGNPYDGYMTNVERFVYRLYKNVLGRTPDADGFAAQVEGMYAMGAAQITYNFYNSDEFKAKAAGMTNEDIVENVYQTMLNRASDEAGKAMWVSYLDRGMSACAIVAGFVEAPEFVELCASYGIGAGSADVLRASLEPRDRNAGVTQFASRLYTVVLNRDAEVDGLNVQCQALQNGMPCYQIAYNFFNSEEFTSFGYDSSTIINVCYKALIGRECESADSLAYWVDRLEKNGLEDVVKGFCQSDEFEAICQECGMTSGMR